MISQMYLNSQKFVFGVDSNIQIITPERAGTSLAHDGTWAPGFNPS